ncbi:MAG: beta-ketoacyl-[acyl-carrier-protein] synthase family protein [Nitrospinae bacterium]|nr:beta-ketoacyl-[acyl-carrier-protein] synthase family protein [Nitrospinota bacterium]
MSRSLPRIVITGVGLAAPNGDNLPAFRQALLEGVSGVELFETRYMEPVPAGICHFDQYKYQSKKAARRGTRAGGISIYCANEAVADAGIDLATRDLSAVGVFIGITEHGTVETENEVYNLGTYQNDVKYWTHHHNPRTVANNPAGEVTLNLKITGPHLCLGAACAAGNVGLIYGAQMLQLGEVDLALAGGVSESVRSFGVFASFAAQGALARNDDPTKACRPFDTQRSGVVVAEGGALFTLERLDDALARNAKIYGELVGWAYNSDASDFVLPNPERQAQCMRKALKMAGLTPDRIDIVNTHGTGTAQGDEFECQAIRSVFAGSTRTHTNNTKSFIGHAMGAAGALELAGNLPSFSDGMVHPTINLTELDPECALPNLVIGTPKKLDRVETILNNSFGMLGINSAVVVKRYDGN